jgi:hypothetical protein
LRHAAAGLEGRDAYSAGHKPEANAIAPAMTASAGRHARHGLIEAIDLPSKIVTLRPRRHDGSVAQRAIELDHAIAWDAEHPCPR